MPTLQTKAVPASQQPREVVLIDPNLERLARLMDSQFEIPGLRLRFGLDSLIGLIPGFGDAITTLVQLYIVASAVRYRVPRVTLFRMGMNIAVDALVGSVPLVGDVFDTFWKANLKNIELLRRATAAAPHAAQQARKSDWLFFGAIFLFLAGTLAVSLTLAYLMIRFLVGR